jgi:hypothetical protein
MHDSIARKSYPGDVPRPVTNKLVVAQSFRLLRAHVSQL